MPQIPSIAPHEACVACFRGDTTTVVNLRGEAEFMIAAIHQLAGLSLDDAARTLHAMAEQDMGCDPGMVPAGRFTMGVRVCRTCAEKTGAVVVEASRVAAGDPVHAYIQPEES